MSNCASCKHWLKIKPTWKEARYFPYTIGRGFCQLVEFELNDTDGKERAMAFIHGYEYEELITKPDFGCNQWEGKENATEQE